jgi:hypothetical protein
MKSKQDKLNDLLVGFLSNIAVAWFAAGVVGAFFNQNLDIKQILFSVGWGLVFSFLSLLFASSMIRYSRGGKRI